MYGLFFFCCFWCCPEDTFIFLFFCTQLGAHVVLTDREDAPWVLDNMRGAVAANGLLLHPPDTPSGCPPSSSAAFGVDGRTHKKDTASTGLKAEDAGKGFVTGMEAGDQPGVRGHGRVEGEVIRDAEEVRGTCSVRGLSWGRVTPAALRLAAEQKLRPQVG